MDRKDVGVSRRQALRAGAYVAGAAWVVPALTVIGAGPAHADSPSGSVPPPTPPVVPPHKPPTKPPAKQPPEVLGTQLTKPPGDPSVEASGLSRLPRTGTEAASIGLLGAGLVAGGVAARVAARRKGESDDLPPA